MVNLWLGCHKTSCPDRKEAARFLSKWKANHAYHLRGLDLAVLIWQHVVRLESQIVAVFRQRYCNHIYRIEVQRVFDPDWRSIDIQRDFYFFPVIPLE